MNTKINTKNLDLSDQISAFIHSKLLAVEKHLNSDDESILCEVEIGIISNHHNSGDIYRSEINLQTPGHNYRSVSKKDELKNAFLDTVAEIIESIKSSKSKEETLNRKDGASFKNQLKEI